MTAIRSQLLAALRGALAWERLPPTADAPAPEPRGPGMLRMLFAIEPLGRDPAPEMGTRERPRLLRMLFAIEPLPRDPPLAPRPRGRWLRWLLTPESLDPP